MSDLDGSRRLTVLWPPPIPGGNGLSVPLAGQTRPSDSAHYLSRPLPGSWPWSSCLGPLALVVPSALSTFPHSAPARVPYGLCDERPQTWWLRTPLISSLEVLEGRVRKESFGAKRRCGQGWFLLEAPTRPSLRRCCVTGPTHRYRVCLGGHMGFSVGQISLFPPHGDPCDDGGPPG